MKSPSTTSTTNINITIHSKCIIFIRVNWIPIGRSIIRLEDGYRYQNCPAVPPYEPAPIAP